MFLSTQCGALRCYPLSTSSDFFREELFRNETSLVPKRTNGERIFFLEYFLIFSNLQVLPTISASYNARTALVD